MAVPASTSQRIIVLSQLPDARVVPSGLKATDLTEEECPLSVFIAFPVSISQRIIFLSLLPDARILPSGLKATELISLLVCPSNFRISLPVEASQSMRILSLPPDNIYLPSGENVTERTEPECPICTKICASEASFSEARTGIGIVVMIKNITNGAMGNEQ